MEISLGGGQPEMAVLKYAQVDSSYSVCPPSAVQVGAAAGGRGGLLSTGLIDGLNFQEDLSPLSSQLRAVQVLTCITTSELSLACPDGGSLTQVPKPGHVQDL